MRLSILTWVDVGLYLLCCLCTNYQTRLFLHLLLLLGFSCQLSARLSPHHSANQILFTNPQPQTFASRLLCFLRDPKWPSFFLAFHPSPRFPNFYY
jgi:hypothetical protein